MKKIFYFILLLNGTLTQAQNVGVGTSTPHSSAKLDVSSVNSGILVPRMSSGERSAIAGPAKSLLVFDNDKNAFMYWDGGAWKMITPANTNTSTEKAPPPADNTYKLGREVAIHGNYAAVASYKTGDEAGVVFVYEKDNRGNWQLKTELKAPNALATDDFGHSIDIDGDYMVIGDPQRRNESGQKKGIAYIYHRINNSWTLEHTIDRSQDASNEDFGWDVAISTTTPQGILVAVSAPRSLGDYIFHDAGKILLYKKTGGSWQWSQNVSSLDFITSSFAGYSLDLEGDLLAIGTPFRDNARGGVYLFRYHAAVNYWEKEYGFTTFNENDAAGYSVSISNNRVAVGCPSFQATTQGRLLLLFKPNANWNLLTINTPTKILEGGYPRFGAWVSLSGDNLLAGAPAYVERNGFEVTGVQPGRAVLFNLLTFQNTLRFSLKQVWQSDYFQADDQFGLRTAISGNSFLISHPKFSTATKSDVGSVQFGDVE